MPFYPSAMQIQASGYTRISSDKIRTGRIQAQQFDRLVQASYMFVEKAFKHTGAANFIARAAGDAGE
ncbi:MAG: hypothetical protein AAF352_03230 [Pseudomonadota bacterium]